MFLLAADQLLEKAVAPGRYSENFTSQLGLLNMPFVAMIEQRPVGGTAQGPAV